MLDEAKNILFETGFDFVEDSSYPLCWTKEDLGSVCIFQSLKSDDEPIVAIELYPNNLHLGEAILLFGEPISARLCFVDIDLNPFASARIYFSNDVFAYALHHQNPYSQEQRFEPYSQEQRFEPDMVIEKIGFFNNPEPAYLYLALPWKGFAFQADISGCGNPPEHTWY